MSDKIVSKCQTEKARQSVDSKSKCLETPSMQDCQGLENPVYGGFLVLEKKKVYDFVMYLQSVVHICYL